MRRPFVIAAAAALFATVAGVTGYTLWNDARLAQGTPHIGGAFSLVDVEGGQVTDRSLLGRPTAIFFGFTWCPEVCPTTLAAMTVALAELGADGDRLNVVFVSVDPERDTPAQMKLYLSNFDRRILGLTGSPRAVDEAARAYRIFHRKVALEGGGYTVDHSSSVYLFDRRGRFVAPVAYGTSQEKLLAELKALVHGR